jgi:hypothetical protein
LSSCSGPWTGQSVQAGFRLTEQMTLTFRGDSFTGYGTDVDGEFELAGQYDPSDDAVSIVRTYVVAPKNPSQVGYPFLYIGRWDGYQIHGRWMMSTHPGEGGSFEMWPQEEEVAFNEMTEEVAEPEVLALPR